MKRVRRDSPEGLPRWRRDREAGETHPEVVLSAGGGHAGAVFEEGGHGRKGHKGSDSSRGPEDVVLQVIGKTYRVVLQLWRRIFS